MGVQRAMLVTGWRLEAWNEINPRGGSVDATDEEVVVDVQLPDEKEGPPLMTEPQ